MLMKKYILGVIAVVGCLLLSGCGSKNTEHGLDAENPVTLEVRTYYNGAPQLALNELVTEFNETVGAEKGIFVEATTSGGLNELTAMLTAELEKPDEEISLPDIFCCYVDMAYELEKRGSLADLNPYMTDDELSEYVDAYIEEGRLNTEDSFYLFPTAKSTEVLSVNKTDWDVFAEATGIDIEQLSTWEGLAETAKAYYEWTDSLTETANDGKALFGRDAVANYMLVGLHQMGANIFQVTDGKAEIHMDEEAMKRLWDNYYVPYISGYFASIGRFRSDDMKTGDIIALVGSSSGAAYLPSKVTIGDSEPYEIEVVNFPVPNFEGTDPAVIQQGAGMAVAKSTETKEYAATVFLKWLTEEENNVKFAVASSYMPVKRKAANIEQIEKVTTENNMEWNNIIKSCMQVSTDEYVSYDLYWVRPFSGSSECRALMGDKLVKKSADDRQAVLDILASGKSLEEAVNEVNTEENFKNWCEDLRKELEKICE